MTKLATRLMIMTFSMALFAMAFSYLVITNQPMPRHFEGGLVSSCAPTGINSCRPIM